MREILFRGKRVDNGEWIYGFYCPMMYTIVRTPLHIIRNDSTPIKEIAVAPDTVGQYTGLTDKNGRKIFEGDILKYNDPSTANDPSTVFIFKIVYEDAGFVIRGIEWPYLRTAFDSVISAKSEIIGNVFELEGGTEQ